MRINFYSRRGPEADEEEEEERNSLFPSCSEDRLQGLLILVFRRFEQGATGLPWRGEGPQPRVLSKAYVGETNHKEQARQ